MATIGCSKEDDNGTSVLDPVEIKLTANQVAMVESNNDFAFDIFTKIDEGADAGENIIFSPLSISYALSMTLNGAEGETLEGMKEALRLADLSVDEINSSYSTLTEALLGVDDKVEINVANSVWTLEGFEVKQEFIERLGEYYDAESKQFTISQESLDEINGWIEEETDGMIKNMLQELGENIRMLLINAIYFEGEWYSGFDEDNTENDLFYLDGGNSVEVPTMKQTENFELFIGDNFAMLELPYGQGNYVMDIVLPNDYDGLANLQASFTGENFNQWIEGASKREVTVYLPRFKYEFKEQLKDILIDMGMGIAFSDYADFSNITETTDLCIGFVQHNAFIETTEKGTKAAAATIVGIIETSYNPNDPPQPYLFNANHPFLYLIREVTTNTVVFMGKVVDPS